MNILSRRLLSHALLLVLVAGSISGCAQIRKVTYPQGFNYLEEGQVDKLMINMGESVNRLGLLVSDTSMSDNIKQQNIVAELSALQSIASRLSGGHEQTNQLFISDHIEQFISDVSTASMFAKTVPPNYSKADDLRNSCQECHQSR